MVVLPDPAPSDPNWIHVEGVVDLEPGGAIINILGKWFDICPAMRLRG